MDRFINLYRLVVKNKVMFQKKQRKSSAPIQSEEPFFKPTVQPKLKMGQKGDQYEVEADHMADKVVNGKNAEGGIQKKGDEEVQQKPLAREVTPFLQKMEAEEEPVQQMQEEERVQKQEEEEAVQQMSEEEGVQKQEEEEAVQTKCAACDKEDKAQKKDESVSVQTKSDNSNKVDSGTESNIKNRAGSGKKMDPRTKAEMEKGFGADFSHINIHTDNRSKDMNREMNSQAFTYGNDIFFNEGKYNPNDSEGKHLLAHELTHTIQQKGMVQKKGSKSGGIAPCCNASLANELPQKKNPFTIDSHSDATYTYCTNKNFRIRSKADWQTPHSEQHYTIRIFNVSGGTVDTPSRRFDIGRAETQNFKVNVTGDCVTFKVQVQVISPSSSPKLVGSFDVL